MKIIQKLDLGRDFAKSTKTMLRSLFGFHDEMLDKELDYLENETKAVVQIRAMVTEAYNLGVKAGKMEKESNL